MHCVHFYCYSKHDAIINNSKIPVYATHLMKVYYIQTISASHLNNLFKRKIVLNHVFKSYFIFMTFHTAEVPKRFPSRTHIDRYNLKTQKGKNTHLFRCFINVGIVYVYANILPKDYCLAYTLVLKYLQYNSDTFLIFTSLF